MNDQMMTHKKNSLVKDCGTGAALVLGIALGS